jgi:hypothetical protein
MKRKRRLPEVEDLALLNIDELVKRINRQFAFLHEYKTASEASIHCPTDSVVFVKFGSKTYSPANDLLYSSSSGGAFKCKADAVADGDVAAP